MEKRNRLRNKKVNQEAEYHKNLFGKEPEIKQENEKELKTNDTQNEETKKTKDTDNAKEFALKYLEQFIVDKANWKFQKVRQKWILQNLYYQHQVLIINKIDNAQFKNTLTYLKGMNGRAKQETIDEANLMIEQNNETDSIQITNTILKRAKKILKIL